MFAVASTDGACWPDTFCQQRWHN